MRPAPAVSIAREINVTPMIDVLLVLLVVFMLAARLRAILSVNVPSPAPSSRPARSPAVVLDLQSDGSYALNGAAVVPGALSDRLRELYASGGRGVLFVRAAPHRRYREVVEMVDVARGAGVSVISYMP